MEQVIDFLKSLTGVWITALILLFFLLLNSWVFKKINSLKGSVSFIKSMISFVLVLLGIVALILSLPIDKSLKGQILGFLGIIISAGFALSSTTILGNLISGIMNNSMKRFRNGDLIKIGEIRGKVTRKSIFHVELQLEDSNFVTIPNLFIASNPVKITRKSDTVISTSISLGYDISRTLIDETLKEAAISAELTDPYVYITELGDYSVQYKIHGFLEDSNKYFSTKSLLNGKVMDALHAKKIEIVSPSFMNQRRVDEKEFIPHNNHEKQPEKDEVTPEELIFDKAIKSEEIEKKKDSLKDIEDQKEKLKEMLKGLKEKKEIQGIKASIKKLDDIKNKLEQTIKEHAKKEAESQILMTL